MSAELWLSAAPWRLPASQMGVAPDPRPFDSPPFVGLPAHPTSFPLASAGVGNSGTHGQWDSLESSLAVTNPRGAIPSIRFWQLGSPTAVLCAALSARESRQTHKTDTYQQFIAAPGRA